MTDHTPAADSVFDQVRVRYAAAALAVTNKKAGACCGTASTIGSDDNHPQRLGDRPERIRPGLVRSSPL